MQKYRSFRLNTLKKGAYNKMRRPHIVPPVKRAERYLGVLLSSEQYDEILEAAVKECEKDIEAATKENCDAFIMASGEARGFLLSSFFYLLRHYWETPSTFEQQEKYGDFWGALQFFTEIVNARMEKDFLQRELPTRSGGKCHICRDDIKTLRSDLAWTDTIVERSILHSAYWYDAPREARLWIGALSAEMLSKHLEKEVEDLEQKIKDAEIQLLAKGVLEKEEAEDQDKEPLTPEEMEQILEDRAKLLKIPRYKLSETKHATNDERERDEATAPKKEDARAKTQFGTREETALYPKRASKRERELAGIRSTALQNIAVFAAKAGTVTIKEPRLRSFSEAFDEAAPSLFSNDDDILPAKKSEEQIPKDVYDYYAVIQTGIIDDLKKGGEGHYYTDIYAFCKTLGITVNARSLPEITKAFEQLNRISPDFGDSKIRMAAIMVTLDPETGALDFYGQAIRDAVQQIKEYNTKVLKDPGKEFAPKNIKAELLRQKDTEAKNAIRQSIAPNFEMRGLYTTEGKNGKVDFNKVFRDIIRETDGFLEAYQAALATKTRGYASRFLKRKLENIVSYLLKFTEYPKRYKDFQVYAVQKRGDAILDTVLHITHRGLADPPGERQGDAAGAGVKQSAKAEQ